jgi:hypothetical protein
LYYSFAPIDYYSETNGKEDTDTENGGINHLIGKEPVLIAEAGVAVRYGATGHPRDTPIIKITLELVDRNPNYNGPVNSDTPNGQNKIEYAPCENVIHRTSKPRAPWRF